MSNDVDVNPEIALNGESPEMASRPYLNEMTQDVIEWDESKNMDLGQMFKSPQPSGSGSKGSKRRTSAMGYNITPSTQNSSLFAGAKHHLDEPCASDTKSHKDREKRNESRTKHFEEQKIDQIPTHATNRPVDDPSLNQRQRRRRVGYAQELKKQQNVGSSTLEDPVTRPVNVALQPQCPHTTICNSATFEANAKVSTASTQNEFAELLESIETPNSSSGRRNLSRVPLRSVDQNKSSISVSEKDQIVPFSSSNINTTKKHPPIASETSMTTIEKGKTFHKPNVGILSEDQTCKAEQHLQPATLKNNALDQELSEKFDQHNKCLKTVDDEFGDIEFSEDDLATIDFLTHPVASHLESKRPECNLIESSKHRNSIVKNGEKDSPEEIPQVKGIKHLELKLECTKESDDEFGDFPSDLDYTEIDSILPNVSNCRAMATLQPQESKPIGDSSTMGTSNTPSKDSKCEEQDARENEDEFGCFLSDVDFSQMDALVATQCRNSKSVDPMSEKHCMITNQSIKTKDEISIVGKKSPISQHGDEFDDFPDDIDFNALDQNISEKMAAQPISTIDPNDIVRNKKSNTQNSSELSFAKFSRYMVLAVDENAKNCTKTLRVASWDNSMLKSDKLSKQILRDGRVKKSEYQLHGDDSNCIFTKAKNIDYPEDGILFLCGEWSFTPVRPGDVIHVCSLTGKYRTDATALPIVLHSYPPPGSDVDDLILVLHPDMLMSPSIISETSSCNRRAALKSKIGSSGISSKSAFIGTMRHGLFEACMKASEFELSFAQSVIKNMMREKAEMLIACNLSANETENEVLGVLPMIQQFAQEYTTLRKDVMMLSSLGKPVGGVACHPDIRLLAKGVHSVEENIVSTSLGLKGSIDAVLETESKVLSQKIGNSSSTSALSDNNTHSLRQSLMSLELKTGHNQSVQNMHMAQLSLYTLMLQNRYGARVDIDDKYNTGLQSPQNSSGRGGATGGILLYLNEKSQKICHISPQINEVKTLMSQRNVVASNSERASRPRGISLSFDETNRLDTEEYLIAKLLPAPAADLPELKANSHSCKRCFSNRECMLYAASDSAAELDGHSDLLVQFTGHLKSDDLDYFRKWDRLIDIEADSSTTKTSTSWLVNSHAREMENGESISGIIFDAISSRKMSNTHALVCFVRNVDASSQSSLENLNIARGSHIIVSTDGATLDQSDTSIPMIRQFHNHMSIAKGYIDRIEDDKVYISTTYDEMDRIKILVGRYYDTTREGIKSNGISNSLKFRIDKTQNSVGTGTLRWNLINFLTDDHNAADSSESPVYHQIKQRRLAWLRDVVIRLKAPEFAEDPQPSLFHGNNLHIPGCNLRELSQEFLSLNDAQKMAVEKVMSGRDYTLIQGLPGTGKTSTLGFLARLLVARGRRVLITAYTHSAVDNIMSKLICKGMGSRNSKLEKSALVRIGSERQCHESVKKILHSELALELDRSSNSLNNRTLNDENVEHASAASLRQVVTACRILGVSALSLPRSPLLKSEIFDVVIVDEAGQMNEPTALGALAAADSFVLVGDHKQLPPLVTSSIAERGGYGISILKKLADEHPHAIAPLTMQYRMNEDICKISSESVYGGQLQCGNEEVQGQLLDLPGFPSSLPTPTNECYIAWLHSVVDPVRSVVFVDTDKMIETCDTRQLNCDVTGEFVALEGKIGGSIVNRTEAKLVWYIVEAMHRCGHDLSEIGVISPFRAQVRAIEDNPAITEWMNKGLELSTIDKYQGRDKHTIILSLVRSNGKGNVGRLLQDLRRLNVAFTRAKCKLIVIGSYRTLSTGSAPLKPILNRMDARKQRVEAPRNALDCYNIL